MSAPEQHKSADCDALRETLIVFAEWRGDSHEDAEWSAETFLRERPIPPDIPMSEPNKFPVPEGWYPLGWHIDQPVMLEFSEQEDEGGQPLWERPLSPGGPDA